MNYRLLPQTIIFFTLLFVSLLSLISGTIYRLYQLNTPGLILAWLILIVVMFIIANKYIKINKLDPDLRFKKYIDDDRELYQFNYIWLFIFLSLLAVNFYLLFISSSTDAIISPWEVINNWFWPAFIILTIIFSFILLKYDYLNIPLSLFYLLVFSVATIIYQLGFGFDSFIHQATEKLILDTGLVAPKPFYYLGQYGLITSLASLGLPINLIDKLLVPVLAALTIPLNLKLSLDFLFSDKRLNQYLVLLTLILPFSLFITTTPQNLAFLFLLNIIIYSLRKLKNYDFILLFILALAALITQPIAGIPAFFFVLILFIKKKFKSPFKNNIARILYLLSASALPIAFLLLNRLQGSDTAMSLSAGGLIERLNFTLYLPNQETVLLNTLYFFGFNFRFLLITLILSGIIIYFRNRDNCKYYAHFLYMGLASLVAYIVTLQQEFSFLIDYERDNYSHRILIVAIIFFLPFVWLSLSKWLFLLSQKSNFYKYTFIIFGALLITASLYFSYPRFDHYHNSHGYSVSASDIKAVEWINQDAEGDYVVLANQQVGAASLQINGFKKYYQTNQGEIFYYPIPTGGPLYQVFLDMVYEEANRSNALQASEITGADTVYFVLNKYWWASPKIANEARQEAVHIENIDQGNVLIYKYIK